MVGVVSTELQSVCWPNRMERKCKAGNTRQLALFSEQMCSFSREVGRLRGLRRYVSHSVLGNGFPHTRHTSFLSTEWLSASPPRKLASITSPSLFGT
jgi:hypothetical protein